MRHSYQAVKNLTGGSISDASNRQGHGYRSGSQGDRLESPRGLPKHRRLHRHGKGQCLNERTAFWSRSLSALWPGAVWYRGGEEIVDLCPRRSAEGISEEEKSLPASITSKILASLAFVAEATNLLLLGPPGVAKTHLAVALHRGPRPAAASQPRAQHPRGKLQAQGQTTGRSADFTPAAQPIMGGAQQHQITGRGWVKSNPALTVGAGVGSISNCRARGFPQSAPHHPLAGARYGDGRPIDRCSILGSKVGTREPPLVIAREHWDVRCYPCICDHMSIQ